MKAGIHTYNQLFSLTNESKTAEESNEIDIDSLNSEKEILWFRMRCNLYDMEYYDL